MAKYTIIEKHYHTTITLKQGDFIRALYNVTKIIYPNFRFKSAIETKKKDEVGNIEVYQQIMGTDAITKDVITIINNGYCDIEGQKLICLYGKNINYVPFFSFNWNYLKSY